MSFFFFKHKNKTKQKTLTRIKAIVLMLLHSNINCKVGFERWKDVLVALVTFSQHFITKSFKHPSFWNFSAYLSTTYFEPLRLTTCAWNIFIPFVPHFKVSCNPTIWNTWVWLCITEDCLFVLCLGWTWALLVLGCTIQLSYIPANRLILNQHRTLSYSQVFKRQELCWYFQFSFYFRFLLLK